MYSINSLTETLGFMSPSRIAVLAVALDAGVGAVVAGALDDFAGEHDDATMMQRMSPGDRTARGMCATF
jgi:hypothetical protein